MIKIALKIKMVQKKDFSEEIEELMTRLESVDLQFFQENILFYISGYMVQKYLDRCICCHCWDILTADICNEYNYTIMPDINEHSSFLKFINRRKLYTPSKIVFDITKYCEKAFKS